jgi:hypothetical protein
MRCYLNTALTLLGLVLGCSACSNDQVTEGACQIAEGAAAPDSLSTYTCRADFDAMASAPLDTSLPGAQSAKVVFDQLDQSGKPVLYFQNSNKYKIHYEFASSHLSGSGNPLVGTLADFNQTEYYAPDRRFVLGAVTYYAGPGVWALEIAPYDTASAAMISALYQAVKKAAYFGPQLVFHPTSEAVAAEAKKLPAAVPVETTDELYASIDYQPLNLATAVGTLHFVSASELATTYLSYREIVVLDHVPNDISVVQGIITEEFQTPLSHVNVLSQNRRTPNMALRGATANGKLRALDGKWVRLTVGALQWSIEEVTSADAEAYWQAHKPTKVELPAADLVTKDLRNVEDVTAEGKGSLRDAIKAAVLAFGGKAAHYSILAKTSGVPLRKAFAIPASYYAQFMQQNGFYARIDQLLADPEFRDKPAVRDAELVTLRADMHKAPVDATFQAALKAKLDAEYPGLDMRFRSSTNSEDLDGFPCAGCYESHTGKAGDWDDVLDAIRDTWASAFLFRTFEERSYYSIDHKSVVMALCALLCSAARLAGCSGSAAPSDTSMGSADVLVGTFQVSLVAPDASLDSPGYTSLVGKVADGPTPSQLVWTTAASAGGCTLSKPRVPFCDTPCTGGAVCVEDNKCQSYPSSKSVGIVRASGIKTATGATGFTMDPIAGGYQASGSLPYPAFAEGAAIELAAAGGVYSAFTLKSSGIAPLQLLSEAIPVASGQAVKLLWTLPEQSGLSTLHVKLDISHHGGTKGMIECEAADSGSLEIPASLVTELLGLGTAGYPTILVTRSAAPGSAVIAPGRVDPNVSSSVERAVQIPGVVSCNDSSMCASGQSCQADLTCK